MIKTNIAQKRRMRHGLFIGLLIFSLLITRIGWIQFVQGSELQTMAYIQQNLDRKINPKRGTIYDSTGAELAVSATVETVTVNPTNISDENKEKVARALSNIFELDYEKVLKKVKKKTSIETIVKKVDKSKTDELRKWMNVNNILTGINIDEDTKRYYPYNNFASQIIGFTGSDNQGLDGIEAKFDKELKGEQGKILRMTDAKGVEIEGEGENYIPAVDGNDIILTIDMTIQSIVEKYLKEACIDNVCTDGGNIVIMNPKTGDILAMATYPDYNLNEPYEPNTEELKANWDNLEEKDKTIALQQMWRNKAITDGYEPGSTFKLITSSAALEEGLTDTDNKGEFACTGSIEIAGVRIKCWRHYRPHGAQSLREALMNSCNPVFIGLGQRVGIEKYYDYLEKFGLLKTTGVDLPGEASGIFLKEEKVGPVELATISFGQRFEITPLQMVTAVSAIANGGTLMKPRIVKEIIDSQTKEVKEIQPEKKEVVISKETATKVLSMMKSVVAEGTGKNAQVAGYSIGGKTGTSEDGVNTNKYVTSFVGVAPIEDPEVVILITLYNPTGEGGHQGGGVAAPIASQVLGEVLPYLDVIKNKQEENNTISIPNFIGMNLSEVKKVLKDTNLQYEIKSNTDEYNIENPVILDQLPKQGITVNDGTKIILYID